MRVLLVLLGLALVGSCAVRHGQSRMLYCVGACIAVEVEEYESELQEFDLKKIAAKRIKKGIML